MPQMRTKPSKKTQKLLDELEADRVANFATKPVFKTDAEYVRDAQQYAFSFREGYSPSLDLQDDEKGRTSVGQVIQYALLGALTGVLVLLADLFVIGYVSL